MKIIGHRGAKGLAPENTLASFAKAIEHKVDEIECDVRVTKDGVPIMAHDAVVLDDNKRAMTVSSHTYHELKKHQPTLTTLQEAIAFVDRRAVMYLEVKGLEPTQPIATCVAEFLTKGWEPNDFLFGSFDIKVLRALKVAMPDIRLIVIENWSSIRATHYARQLKTKYVSINQKWLWSGLVYRLKQNGYRVYSFTLNNPRKAQHLAHYGLYGAITDNPALYESAS